MALFTLLTCKDPWHSGKPKFKQPVGLGTPESVTARDPKHSTSIGEVSQWNNMGIEQPVDSNAIVAATADRIVPWHLHNGWGSLQRHKVSHGHQGLNPRTQ